MNLIVVESPTKAKTLGRFLGSGWQLAATMGHIRDLPEKKIGIKIERVKDKDGDYKFSPEYVQTGKQKERMKEILEFAKVAENIYLATDPDREGEAIAFHVNELLRVKSPVHRISFHEITDKAVSEALSNPGEINMPLVDAQQARRMIDRLVGYKLSPLLWAKVRKGLSAGRVQSVAVRLVCDKEKEIEAFKSQEYWEVEVILQKINEIKTQFSVDLTEKNNRKLKIENGEQAELIEKDLQNSIYEVGKIEKKDFKRTPPAPFTTSVLQQTAANRFGWTPKKTMQIAQSLYELGHITYHRTDSTNVATEAVEAARQLIVGAYGSKFALEKPRLYKVKSRVAQEAHEAIRPTDLSQTLNSKFEVLNKDQDKLYELIWKRFVACQMAEATGVSMTVDVKAGEYLLEAKGEKVEFEGWTKVYNEGREEAQQEKETELPPLAVGERLDFVKLVKAQKFTQPPARYNEASLIKKLEEMGIGRPSTYAPILSTIQDRQYVEKVERRLKPTALGIAANEFLTSNFARVLDFGFTAKMEEELDEIANGKMAWQKTLGEFWGPLSMEVERVKQTAERVKVEVEKTGEICPKCQKGEVIVRIGKFGRFLACSLFPECDYRANYVNKIGIPCPKCGGDVILRKTRSKKSFYGCSNYPKCDFASWVKPKP